MSLETFLKFVLQQDPGKTDRTNKEDFDLNEIKTDLKKLKDEMDPIRSDVEQSVHESEATLQSVSGQLRTAESIDEQNAETVDTAEQLKLDVDDALDTARGKLNAMDSDHNSMNSRATEVCKSWIFDNHKDF